LRTQPPRPILDQEKNILGEKRCFHRH
jgi:hypothetical protein